MSKTLSAGMSTHLAGSLTTLATCMLITRTDAAVFGFTTFDRPMVIDGVTYESTASFNPTDIASNLNLDIDNVTVEGFLDSDTLTEDELRAGRWDYAAFRIFQVNWSDLTMGQKKDRCGHLGECTVNVQTFVAELMGLMEAYVTSVGSMTQAACRNNLGDRKCKVDLTGLTVSGTIDTATDFATFTDPARSEADGYFTEGIMTITSGIGAGLSYEVKDYAVVDDSPPFGTWSTKVPVAYDLTGATYDMTPGCDRSFATCRDRFANVINYNGEPWLRGLDAMMQVGRHNG